MKVSKYLIPFVLFLTLGLVSACSGKNEAPADAPEATERGLSDAKALLTISTDNTRDLHSALLSVKSREWEMRRNGDNVAADAYINAFKDYVAGHDKSLADEIF